MRVLLIAIVLCILTQVNAQMRPLILLEDMDEHSLELKCYCKPGVRNKTRSKGIELSYQLLGSGDIAAPNNEFAQPYPEYSKFRKLRTKVSIPIIRQERLKTVMSFSYDAEQYEIENIVSDYQQLITSTNNINFKSSSIDLSWAYSLNEKNYLGGKFSLSYNGSYDGLVSFSQRYAVYSAGVAYGIKNHEDNEWGVVLDASKNFRNQGLRALPFLFWNKTLNDKWGFQLTLPSAVNLRYNMNSETILIASANFNGDSYSFDQVSINNRPIAFNHSEILTTIKLQRQIIPWLWLDLQAGYHFNFNSSFELQTTQETLLTIDPGNSILMKFGIFVSPPDKFLD